MKVIVTGPRDHWPWKAIRDAFRDLPVGSVIVHGAHSAGVDAVAWRVAIGRGVALTVVPVPADWDGIVALGKPRKAAGPIRNQRMTDEHRDADACWAFVPPGWVRKGGTADMCRRATAAGIPVRLIECEAGM